MNACSIKGTSYEKEYRNVLKLSEPAMIFVWNANNEQPLDKRKVGDEVVDNPLYDGLLGHPVTKGDRTAALKLVAQSFLPLFTRQYTPDETGNYSVEQVVDFVEKRQRQAQEQREQLQQSINLPTSMSITLHDVEINGSLRSVYFSAEQGQDIFDTFQYLLGENKSWDNVYTALTNQRNTLLSRVKEGKHFADDVEKLAYTEIILKAFDKMKSWYNDKGSMVGEAELDDEFGDSEDWKTKDKSQVQRASSVILGLVASLPSYRTAIPGEIDFETGEEYQEVTQVQVKGTVIGTPKASDFQKNWSLLGTTLSGITSYTEMYGAIEALAARYPQFQNLLNKIPNPKTPGSFKDIKQFLLASEFKRVFSVPEVLAIVVDVTQKEGKIVTSQQVKGFAPIRNAVNLYDSEYFSYNQRYLIEGVDGKEVNLDLIVEDFAPIFANLGSALSKKVPAENFLFGSRLNELVRFMQAVGLGLKNQDYLKSTNQQGTIEFIAANLSNLKALFEKIKVVTVANTYLPENAKIRIDKPLSFLRDTVQSVYVEGKIRQDVLDAIAQAFADKKITYKGKEKQALKYLSKKSTELNTLVNFFSQFDAEFRPSSYLNAADKKKFVRGPWFYLTQQTKILNRVNSYAELIQTPGFERFDYRKNPDILGSVWLERMFGLPRKLKEIEKKDLSSYQRKKDVLGNPIQISIANFDGMEIKGFGEKSGKTTTDQHPGDKIFQDFASFFQSLEMENIRFGDKTSALTTRSSNPVLSEKIYVPLNANIMLEPSERTEAEQELTNLFNGYLASESKRLLDLIEQEQRGTTYDKLGKNLFIFNDILPQATLKKFKEATTKEQIIEAYTEATAMMSTVLQEYFQQESEKLVDKLIDIFTMSVNIDTGNVISRKERLNQTVDKLNKLNLFNSQLFPEQFRENMPKITAENLPYIAELYLKNGFVHNVEFLKVFVGDLSNFDKTNKDAREAFKRIPFTSSPGNVFFWDKAAEEFFATDENQDALSRAYTGVSNKFSPVLKTVIYNDVATFSPDAYQEYQKAYDSDNWDQLTEDEKSEFSEYVNNPKEADAQGVITLDSYRNYLMGINRWSPEQEQAYNKQVRLVKINQELKNNPANAEELYAEKNEIQETFGAALFPPLKLGQYGSIVEDPKLIALHKFSLVPLIPSTIEGKQLEKQLELMYKNNINYYTFKSGSKMAQYGKPINFYKEVTNAQGEKVLVVNDALSSENVTSIHLENLREQQYQAPKFKGKGTLSTQMMKLVFGDFFENGEISSDFSEATQKEIERLYNVFKGNLENIISFEKVKLERKLGIQRDAAGNIVSVDQLQMARFFAEELEKKEAPEALRRFIQVNPDGSFKYPLDAINNRNQLESLVLNVVNNKVISQKINGESYIQVAGTGFESKRYAKPTAEQLKEFGANELQFYRLDPVTGETLPMEVKVGFNSKKHGGLLRLDYKGNRVRTLAQLNKILKSTAPADVAWKKLHADKLSMVGVRIPVQGFQSMEYVTVKEFLPESSGAIMVLPAQIVTKSGGDYDIDKLTFFETSYNRQGETYKKPFNLVDYKQRLDQQSELKKARQELLALRELTEKEISENDIYQQRDSLRKEIQNIKKETQEAIDAINELTDSSYLTKEDAALALELVADNEDLRRAFADLDSFDQENDTRALVIINKIRTKLRELNKKSEEIDEYKNSLTNNLVSTLVGVLKQGELYDALVTPNTNSVLTQYTKPGEKLSTTDLFNPLTSWRIYMENILSKDALGIDAKINTLQKEFQRAGLKYTKPLFRQYYFKSNKDAEGNILLGGKKDAEGVNRISKVLSEFINGHVDIAKEDWIILLGLDQETSPLAHAMILAGTPVRDVLGLINSPIIKTVLQLGNRPEIHKKLDKIRPNKKKAILGLIKANINKITDPALKEVLDSAKFTIAQLKSKSDNAQADVFVNALLTNPEFNKYITNFDPQQSLSEQETTVRDLAYLMQFYVVLRQQESLRKLTSITDFNTSNYRTSFQSDELVKAEGDLKEDFNESAINFMFKDSALAQFNISSFVQEFMGQIYPLSDSRTVHADINRYLDRKGVFKEEERMQAIQAYKNNLLVPYVLTTAQTADKGNLLEYYRGKDGIFLRTNSNNMEKRFESLLQYPELRNNFLINNLYIEQDNSAREIEFKLKNTDVEENSGSYRNAFLEGMNSSIPEIKSFFEDLALGSYLQYAGSFSTGHVSNIVPHEAYVEYTTKAYEDLVKMKDSDSKKFEDYLTLVRFSTKLSQETEGPIKGLGGFFVSNYGELAKTIKGFTPEVLATLNRIQGNLTQVELTTEPTIQPSTNVTPDQGSQSKFTGEMTYAYGTEKRAGVTANTTFDAILSGERTATTRFEKDGKLNYWKQAKVGDVITWKAADGRTVDVVVTRELHPLKGSGKTPELWSQLEGWSTERFNKKVKPNIGQAYQIEFRLAEQPIKPAVVDLFNENPELASIGTPQQYSAYLDTIFPNSKVKDILAHISRVPNIEKFRINQNTTGNFINSQVLGSGIYFTPPKFVDYWSMELGFIDDITGLYTDDRNIYYTIVNSKHPQYFTKNYIEDSDVDPTTDIVVNNSRVTNEVEEYVVKDPEIIYILGNKQDIEGFKKFVNAATTQPSTSVEVKNKVGDIVDIIFDINGKDINVKAKILSIEKGNEFTNNGITSYYYFVDLENIKTGKKYEFEIDEYGDVSQALGANGKTMVDSSAVVDIVFDREAVFGKQTQLNTQQQIILTQKEVIENFEDDVQAADTTPTDTTTSFTPTKNAGTQLNLFESRTEDDDKGNLGDIDFTEGSCELPR